MSVCVDILNGEDHSVNRLTVRLKYCFIFDSCIYRLDNYTVRIRYVNEIISPNRCITYLCGYIGNSETCKMSVRIDVLNSEDHSVNNNAVSHKCCFIFDGLILGIYLYIVRDKRICLPRAEITDLSGNCGLFDLGILNRKDYCSDHLAVSYEGRCILDNLVYCIDRDILHTESVVLPRAGITDLCGNCRLYDAVILNCKFNSINDLAVSLKGCGVLDSLVVKLNYKTLCLVEREALPSDCITELFILGGNNRSSYRLCSVRIEYCVKHCSVCHELYAVKLCAVYLYVALRHVKDRMEIFIYKTFSNSCERGKVLDLCDLKSCGKNSLKCSAVCADHLNAVKSVNRNVVCNAEGDLCRHEEELELLGKRYYLVYKLKQINGHSSACSEVSVFIVNINKACIADSFGKS